MFCRGVFQKNFLFQYKEKNSVFCGGSSPKKIVLHYTESKSPLWGSVFKKCSKNIIVLIVRTRNPDFLRFFRQNKKSRHEQLQRINSAGCTCRLNSYIGSLVNDAVIQLLNVIASVFCAIYIIWFFRLADYKFQNLIYGNILIVRGMRFFYA